MTLEFPLWLRVTHLLNFLFLGFLIRSGIEILASHPRLYFNDGCTPGSEWLKFTRRKVPTNTDIIYTARDDEIDASPWLALPGHKNIGLARHWHGVVTMLWIITGFVYVALLFGTGEWRRLVPTSWDVFPRAWHSLLTYLSLHAPPLSDFQPYDGLQQLTYFGVVFLLGPLMIATGAAQSPAVIARFPRYSRLFGGRQNARSLHFLGMALFTLFILVHVVLVLMVHPRQNLTNITLGGASERFGLAVGITIAAVLAVFGIWAWTTVITLRRKRRTQVVLDTIEAPARKLLLRRLDSRQHYSEADISPYHWVNGAPPSSTESPEFLRLAEGGFREWRLRIGGLVENEISLSLDEIKALPSSVQITKHNCVQGWTGVAKWKGVHLRDVLALVKPLPEARYLKFTSYGLSQYSYGGKPLEPFYEVIDTELAGHNQTILAYEMNDQPLPARHGAPLRLRVETQVGYKMVKYLRSIEWIADYRDVGDGQGGSREDAQFMGRGAEI